MAVPYNQYTTSVTPGSHHQTSAALPLSHPDNYAARFIAYYLPQYHQIPENDEWWGEGFTEWTNVAKAMPRYKGHYQPRMPSALGFYDLSNVNTIRKQVDLAKRGGIYGFCIHDYWFDGRRVLENPIKIIRDNLDIDINFCINWANENWTRSWDGLENDILLQQRYSPKSDVDYGHYLLDLTKDRRYIRVEGRPLVMVYRPSLLPDSFTTFERWRDIFRLAGEPEPFLVMPQAFGNLDPRKFGMDAAAGFPPHASGEIVRNDVTSLPLLDPTFQGQARSYRTMISNEINSRPNDYTLFPGVCPNWDNEARKPGKGTSYYGSTPALYSEWLNNAARYCLDSNTTDQAIVFINAWNEWGEGAYLEPDRHDGFAYLAETRHVLDRLSCSDNFVAMTAYKNSTKSFSPNFMRRILNVSRRELHKVFKISNNKANKRRLNAIWAKSEYNTP
jgi:lipopolysaccharide biosynthesis protein